MVLSIYHPTNFVSDVLGVFSVLRVVFFNVVPEYIYNLKMNKNVFLGVFPLLGMVFGVLSQLRVVICRPFSQIILIFFQNTSMD